MDRQFTYPGAIPLETDLLNTNRNVLTAIGALIQDLFGTSTLMSGLSVVPTSPATLSVNVNPGRVYSLQNLDNTAYSSLPANTALQIMKQGILSAAQNLATPAPVTAGYSINYLVSAAFLEVDINPVVLPYYNAVNPQQAWSGAGGSGLPNNTTRENTVALTLTPGVPATTGSQATPAAPVGSTPLYVITVAYGQSTVTAANIVASPEVPLAPTGGFFASVGERFSSIVNVTATSVLVPGNAGALINITATGTTQTLPAAASLTNGESITFVYMQSSGSATITCAGTDILQFGQGNSSSKITLNPGEEVQFVSNGSNGWVSAGQTLSTGVTASLGDNSTKFSTTAFVQRALGNAQSGLDISATTQLTAAQAGSVISLAGNTAYTATLPPISSVPNGGTFSFFASNSAGVNVAASGSDLLIYGSGTQAAGGSLVFLGGDSGVFVNIGGSWALVNGTLTEKFCAGMSATLSVNGYQKLPSGVIIQWGSNSFSGASGSINNYNYPIAFPNGGFFVCGSIGSNLGTVNFGFQSNTNSQFSVGCTNSNGGVVTSDEFSWIAIGH